MIFLVILLFGISFLNAMDSPDTASTTNSYLFSDAASSTDRSSSSPSLPPTTPSSFAQAPVNPTTRAQQELQSLCDAVSWPRTIVQYAHQNYMVDLIYDQYTIVFIQHLDAVEAIIQNVTFGYTKKILEGITRLKNRIKNFAEHIRGQQYSQQIDAVTYIQSIKQQTDIAHSQIIGDTTNISLNLALLELTQFE